MSRGKARLIRFRQGLTDFTRAGERLLSAPHGTNPLQFPLSHARTSKVRIQTRVTPAVRQPTGGSPGSQNHPSRVTAAPRERQRSDSSGYVFNLL